MLFSFLTRSVSSKPKQHTIIKAKNNDFLNDFVLQERGELFSNFKLFHNESITVIDTLIFLPHFGIFLGETISWQSNELKNATVGRSSRRTKRSPETHFETMESKIRRKLEDVLSFDSTPIFRFIWMRNLTESEFDMLDSSFHELLPKGRLLFSDESAESIKAKFYSFGEYRHNPYSVITVMGALNPHSYILPTARTPSGALLSVEQNLFLTSQFEGITTLAGGHGSGKSTLLIRKALNFLLSHPQEKVIIITPTRLGGELLRDELVSLLEYGVLSIDLSALHFYTPVSPENGDIDRIEDLKIFQKASIILCDDSHLMEKSFMQKVEKQRGKRWLLVTNIKLSEDAATFKLSGQFRRSPVPKEIYPKHNRSAATLLVQLRKILVHTQPSDILIAVSTHQESIRIKELIDNYFHLNCRVLTPASSLQYQDLNSIIITTADCIAPLSRAHVILMSIDASDPNYPLALSRASESLTIISSENLIRKDPADENYENG